MARAGQVTQAVTPGVGSGPARSSRVTALDRQLEGRSDFGPVEPARLASLPPEPAESDRTTGSLSDSGFVSLCMQVSAGQGITSRDNKRFESHGVN